MGELLHNGPNDGEEVEVGESDSEVRMPADTMLVSIGEDDGEPHAVEVQRFAVYVRSGADGELTFSGFSE